ncbi:MAG TPA: hypothetical protein VJM11_10310 [Nevskiaceae bacterium]|nr:hypothetical protein [Nevskiaceae bacterium]
MSERRAVASFFLPLGAAGCAAAAALVFAAMRARDTVDTFVVTGAELASPDYQETAPITAGSTIDPTEKRFFAVNTHRVQAGAGTVIGWRWFSNGDLSSDNDESYRKLSLYLPGDLPAKADVDLADAAAATTVYTWGGSAWPQSACWGRVSPGTLHVERNGDAVTVHVKGTLGLSGRTPADAACEKEMLDLTFTAKPVPLGELTAWLGATGTRVSDETYRKVKP